MAKRAAPDEQPFRPLLDASLVSAAIANRATQLPNPPPPARVIDIPRPEAARPIETAKRELQVPPTHPPEPLRAPQPVVEKIDQEKRILFTRAETQSIERLVMALATRVRAQVKASHVIRALVTLLLNAESEIDRRAGEAGALVRPPNGDVQALQRFERQIAGIIANALRDAGPLRE